LNRFGGLPHLLGKRGYRTVFVHGGELRFDNLNRALPGLGFQESIGMRRMEKTGRYGDRRTWGYHDEASFDMLLRSLARKDDGRPVFAVIFTVNTHHPYAVPRKEFRFFPSSLKESKFLNAYRYTDHALGKFMKEAKTRPFFPNTFFLFVADHPHHAGLNYLEDRVVPFLLHAPGRVRPGVDSRISSQLDMLPTILALAGGDSWYAAMGRDLTSPPSGAEFAFYAGGSGTNVVGWTDAERISVTPLSMDHTVLFTSRFPANMKDYAYTEKKRAREFREKALRFHQFARDLERENRIWPPDGFFKTGKRRP